MEVDNNDALVLIHLRNEFYRQKYYLALGVYLLTLCVAAVLIGMLVYLMKHPTEPLYFPADDVSRLVIDVPLTQPNMSVEDVEAWTVAAVEAAYTYNYVNYRAQLQDTQKYFSTYGWIKYMQGLKASNNLDALTKRRMIFIAKVVDKPKIIGQGILKTGSYGYKMQMPLLVTYTEPNKPSYQNPLTVSVVVQRQPILSSYKGLGIMQMIATIASS